MIYLLKLLWKAVTGRHVCLTLTNWSEVRHSSSKYWHIWAEKYGVEEVWWQECNKVFTRKVRGPHDL